MSGYYARPTVDGVRQPGAKLRAATVVFALLNAAGVTAFSMLGVSHLAGTSAPKGADAARALEPPSLSAPVTVAPAVPRDSRRQRALSQLSTRSVAYNAVAAALAGPGSSRADRMFMSRPPAATPEPPGATGTRPGLTKPTTKPDGGAPPPPAQPPGVVPTSTVPTSTVPTSTVPTSTVPTSTGPTSTGPTSTVPTSTGPTSTGPTSTGPTKTGPTRTGPTSTGPTRPSGVKAPAPKKSGDAPVERKTPKQTATEPGATPTPVPGSVSGTDRGHGKKNRASAEPQPSTGAATTSGQPNPQSATVVSPAPVVAGADVPKKHADVPKKDAVRGSEPLRDSRGDGHRAD